MTDFVEIPDDNSSDNEVQEQQPQPVTATNHAFDELRSLKSEMEFRGSLLGKTWSELSSIMTRYQAQIIQKHEQLDNSLSGADHFRLTQMENDLKKCRTDNVRLQKQVTDLESKILEKDSEIVQLRTDFHKAKNEVMMKDNLIQKLQAQMAQEAMDYQTEISALKDVLEQGDYGGDENMGPVPISSPQLVAMASPQPKRRKVTPKQPPMPRPQMSPSPRKPTPARLPPTSTSQMDITSSVKTETFQSPCRMAGPSTSGQSEMDSSYTDQSFNEPQDDGSGQEQSFFKVDEVYDDSNSGIEAVLPGHDPSTMLEMGGQEQHGLQSGVHFRSVKDGMTGESILLLAPGEPDDDLSALDSEDQQKILCRFCGVMLKNKKIFRMHMIVKHDDQLQNTNMKKPKHACSFPGCGKKFISITNKTDHEDTHFKRRSRKCTETDDDGNPCDKSFVYQKDLKTHLFRVHGKGDIGKRCSNCNKLYPAQTHRRHQLHCGQPPQHACGICGKKFVHLFGLERHQKRFHDV